MDEIHHNGAPPPLKRIGSHRQKSARQESGGPGPDKIIAEVGTGAAVESPTMTKRQSMNIFEVEMEDVSKSYNIGKDLGYGKYGIVRLVSKKSYEKKRFALKTISRTLMVSNSTVGIGKEESADSQPLLENEFEILK